jgi:tRNA-specific 2-thiouridylase
MKPKTAVAISGGVDSLMAACLLQKQGQQVIGIHFITGFETNLFETPQRKETSHHPIHNIGEQLGIPVKIVNLQTEFQEKIVDYFTRTYRKGRTPNPCLRCNPTIKFGTLLSCAQELGAQNLATGHYARKKKDESGRHHLFKALDRQKDQSYFLARLTQKQLAKARFPLAEMKKSEVKKIALEKGYRPVSRRESQDVCFISHGSYGEFLAGQKGFEPKPGLIEDVYGHVIGKHKGLHLFTVGQRRGINCPAAEPYYVVRLDIRRNRLIVGAKKDLLSSGCKVTDINWIVAAPISPTEISTRVRYRSRELPATILPRGKNTAIVRFKNPQPSVTPGQGAVFYQNDEILGGGWIEQSIAHGT